MAALSVVAVCNTKNVIWIPPSGHTMCCWLHVTVQRVVRIADVVLTPCPVLRILPWRVVLSKEGMMALSKKKRIFLFKHYRVSNTATPTKLSVASRGTRLWDQHSHSGFVLTPIRSRLLVEELIVALLFKKFFFYVTLNPFSCSQNPTTGPYSEPVESNTYPVFLWSVLISGLSS